MQAVDCMRSKSPGFWYTPQSLRPAMNIDGTSMVRPDISRHSAVCSALVMQRYHCNPPWKPVRAYSAL